MISIKYEVNYSWWLLRLVYGVTFIGAGVDKFFSYAVVWSQFVHPSFAQITGLSVLVIVYLAGVIEIALGVLVFTNWVKMASLLIAAWMIANGVYLAFFHMYLDTAARYCTLGICALVLFHLTRVREKLMH